MTISVERENGAEFEPFDRKSCLMATLTRYTPRLHNVLSIYHVVKDGERMTIEDIFLTEEKHPYPNDRGDGYRLASIDHFARETVSTLLNRVDHLTDEEIRAQNENASKKLRNYAHPILDKADELGLTESIDMEQAEQIVSDKVNMNIEYADGSWSWNWKILPTVDNEFSLLVGKDDHSLIRVNLSSLFEQDPDFVKEQIRRYYRDWVDMEIAGSMIAGIEQHRVPWKKVVPPFIQQAPERDEEIQQLNEEAQNILHFLKIIGSYRMHSGTPHDFLSKLKIGEFEVEGVRVNLEYYLRHLSSCPGENDDVIKKADKVLRFYRMFALSDYSIIYQDRPPDEGEIANSVLDNPFYHTPRVLDRWERKVRQQRENEEITESRFEEQIEEINVTRNRIESYLDKTGISEEIIESLLTFSEVEDEEHYYDNVSGDVNFYKYYLLFRTLHFASTGEVNIDSPYFRSFF